MSWTRDYRAGMVRVHFQGQADPSFISGISSLRMSANTEVRKERSAASVYPDVASVAAVAPVIGFTTFNLIEALTAIPPAGICGSSDGSHEGLTLYGSRHDCSGIAAGSVHDKYVMAKGVVVPRTLSVDHRGNAELSYEAICSWDGTNDPIARTPNVALPTATASKRFTMEDLTIAGYSVVGKRSISLDFGCETISEGADSEKHNTVTSIRSISPVLTVRGVDTSWLTDVAPLLGKTIGPANSVLSLQRRDFAKNLTEHITIALSGTVVWDTIFDGTPDSPAQAAFSVHTMWDGTNAPLGVSLSVAIG